MEETSSFISPTDIAIIGIAGRFPGAKNPEAFWRNLRDGVESITRFTEAELTAAGVDAGLLDDPNYVPAGAVFDDLDMFDAGLFNLSPKDAAIMDPQHRQFLETAWEALENAGYNPDTFPGSIGVYGGCGMGAYMMFNLLRNRKLMDSTGLFLVRHTGNDKDFLTTRVSYQFNLKGPSVNVQTACSTSLVAIHLACQNLLNGECDAALAGGVTMEIPHKRGYLYQEGEILSRDGHCRAFDADATGTIFGSGAGIVMLRRLEDAYASGDTIHAIIKGSAINNDGSGKVGYLAPSVDGQASAVAEALGIAAVEAESIGYIATHGTGTRVGDPIEIAALTEAFRRTTKRKQFCAVGSIKTNIGHLDTAAGVASLIAAVQALKHRQLPPSLHFRKANPLIDFESSPFYVNAELRDWNASPRRAGVSSLGVGGTNAHIVLEEAPVLPAGSKGCSWQLLPISARTAKSLDGNTERLIQYLRETPDANLSDVAYTLQVGRKALGVRRVAVCSDAADAANTLESLDAKRTFTQEVQAAEPSIVFLFSGGGAQYPNMGRDLYAEIPVYRDAIDRCLELARTHVGEDLRAWMFPAAGREEAAARQLERPSLGLPALFMTEYALAEMWMSWGIRPSAMIGHSVGAYAEACIAGGMPLEDGLSIVALRGRLFETLRSGSMLTVSLAEEQLRPMLHQELAIAAINAPAICTVSGETEAINELEKQLVERGIECRRLHISVAAHSPLVEPILPAFLEGVKKLRLSAPKIPYISGLTGTWVTPEQATDPEFWVKKLRQTVRFADGLSELLKDGNRMFLEVGPGQSLSTLVRQHPARQPRQSALASLRHPQDTTPDLPFLFHTLGRLWSSGTTVDWEGVHKGERRRRIPLPTYAFDQQRYWIDAPKSGDVSAGETKRDQPARRKTIEEWFYEPYWQAADLPASSATGSAANQCWLVFEDESGFGSLLRTHLQAKQIIRVTAGAEFGCDGDSYQIDPRSRQDYDSLLNDLAKRGLLPDRVVHLWSVAPAGSGTQALEQLDGTLERSFHSLLYLSQALGEQELSKHVHIGVVSNNLHSFEAEDGILPARGVLIGQCKVIPRELPDVSCQSIDIDLPSKAFASALQNGSGAAAGRMAVAIVEEVSQAPSHTAVLYRNRRYVEEYRAIPPSAQQTEKAPVRPQGTYLITGGLGAIGTTFASYLAENRAGAVVFIGRRAFPEPDTWSAWIREHGPADATSQQIAKLQSFEQAGTRVHVARADVADAAQMSAVIEDVHQRFGAIHGVLHAAGVLDDGVIQLKEPAAASRVLAPKVRGTLVLDALLAQEEELDFVLLLSSTSAILGPAGQVDYAAANSFLDVFAKHRRGMYRAIDSGPWKDAGMAVRAATKLGIGSAPDAAQPAEHPLLGSRISDSAHQTTYEAVYDPEKFWVLSEHQVKAGNPVVPGTALLEIALASAAGASSRSGGTIRDASFWSPLEVRKGEPRLVRVNVSKTGSTSSSVTIVSRRAGDTGDPDSWKQHAVAEVSTDSAAAAQQYAIEELVGRCKRESWLPGNGEMDGQRRYLQFGPRWDCIKAAHFGESEAVAILELPDSFGEDLQSLGLHPALLDMATGFGIKLVPGYSPEKDLYVPLGYKGVRVHSPLQKRIFSHARLRSSAPASELAVFDITITDEKGHVLIEVSELTFKRLASATVFSSNGTQAEHTTAAPAQSSIANPLLPETLRDGIGSADGSEVFRRVLAMDAMPRVVVSPVDLHHLIHKSQPVRKDREAAAPARAKRSAAPSGTRDDIEAFLVETWQDLLGVDQVLPDDDFFDLGGHSLVAVRLFTKLKKAYDVEFGLATLFEARTVRQLAKLLRKPEEPKSWSSLVPIRSKGSLPPLYMVHGVGGNVVGFDPIVKHLGEDQPVYALQSQGLDGIRPYLTKLEDMAAHYLEEIRSFQPKGPYYLLGYSFGGLIAFEMAQQLHAAGETIGLLGMLDSYQLTFLKHRSRLSPRSLSVYQDKLRFHTKNIVFGPDRFAYIRAGIQRQMQNQAHRAAGPVAETPYSVVEQINQVAGHSYEPRPYPGRITLFRASIRPAFEEYDYTLGWSGLALAGVEVHDVSGDHLTMGQEPHVQDLSGQLELSLRKARSEWNPAARKV